MKILKQNFREEVVVKSETLEDLWNLKKIVAEGDILGAKTFRSVEVKGNSEKVPKRPMFLKIKVEKIEFDEDGQSIKLGGKIVEGPEDVPHAHHTLAIGINDTLSIIKEKWRESEKRALKESVKYKGLKALIVVCDEREADFALATEVGLKSLTTIKSKSSGKGFVQKDAEKMVSDYYDKIVNYMKEHTGKVDRIILAGPGFTKDNVYQNIKDTVLKGKITLFSASITGKTGLNEVVKRGALQEVFKESRITEETSLVNEFLTLLSRDSKKITYGLEHVKKAVNSGAVETLLVSDKLVRKDEIEELLKKTEESGGEIHIINSEHEAGEQLLSLTGIAAFLRYAVE